MIDGFGKIPWVCGRDAIGHGSLLAETPIATLCGR